MPKKTIRTLLIQPPNIGSVKSLLSHIGDEGEGIGSKPPLGLLSIATYLRKKTSHEVQIIDAQAKKLNFDECLQGVLAAKPDVVGVSTWTDWWYSAYHLGQLIRHHLPGVHICYGGPHVCIYPEETLLVNHSDSVIVGDGEIPFSYLCNMLGNQNISNDFPGLHFKEYGVKQGEKRFFIQKNLDDLPVPDRTILPMDNYTSVLSKSEFITTMVTSRGCPFRCTYCKLGFQKALFRSPENIVEEFRNIQKSGIKEIEIYDDTFTSSKSRLIEICQRLLNQKINIAWSIRDRVSSADPELLDIMKRAGCKRIHYGIESGVDRILYLMKKNITTEQARNAVRLAKKKKFAVLAYYMIGNRGETIEDIQKTIDFALELDADYAEFSITVPYPGTEMYFKALKDEIISYDYWREFALSPKESFSPPELIEENVTLKELLSFRDQAIRRYYFRWRFILREILKIRNRGEFKRRLKMGLRLISSLKKRRL